VTSVKNVLFVCEVHLWLNSHRVKPENHWPTRVVWLWWNPFWLAPVWRPPRTIFLPPKEQGFTMTNSEIVLSMLGLLVQAKPDFEAIEPFR